MPFEVILVVAGIYVVVGRWIVGLRMRGRDPLFAVLNLAVVYLLFFANKEPRFRLLSSLFFLAYVVIVCFQYYAMRLWSGRRGWSPWIAFLIPIAVLIGARCIPVLPFFGWWSPGFREVLQRHPEFSLNVVFIGISYMAFRTSYLVLEVRNGIVPRPDLCQYLGFAFFVPTVSVGPINTYGLHRRAFEGAAPVHVPVGRALLRVLVGG